MDRSRLHPSVARPFPPTSDAPVYKFPVHMPAPRAEMEGGDGVASDVLCDLTPYRQTARRLESVLDRMQQQLDVLREDADTLKFPTRDDDSPRTAA